MSPERLCEKTKGCKRREEKRKKHVSENILEEREECTFNTMLKISVVLLYDVIWRTVASVYYIYYERKKASCLKLTYHSLYNTMALCLPSDEKKKPLKRRRKTSVMSYEETSVVVSRRSISDVIHRGGDVVRRRLWYERAYCGRRKRWQTCSSDCSHYADEEAMQRWRWCSGAGRYEQASVVSAVLKKIVA